MRWTLPIFLLLATLTGCGGVPLLTSRADLKPNVGQLVRVDGTAHFYKIGCPSISTDEFELFVYPRDLWGRETNGQHVEVIGRLNDTVHTLPPDSYINPGEYWLSETTFAPEEK